ncbi:hypothetical protein PBAL39_06621 [Pedobacter sp. BAL39]|uniref:hypothetical protein n=1 Tax=Pedobacter sp. BAL39 TaxID=391596 RepID=UPI0001559C20|nr:hypothetical protein [Pedobacter sp. BAL39]EDM35832.1 hypothetical protein PBAL39_06621 [Pedobacter sp. BAL39]
MNFLNIKSKLQLTSLFCSLVFVSTLSACGNSDKKQETNQDSAAAVTTTTEAPAAATTEKFEDFDWSTVQSSTANIGTFPYLTAPEGFFIQDKGGYDESKTGYSDLKDFNKLIMFTGNSFYNAEGKVARLKFSMKDKEADWNQYKFDTSIEKYLDSVGAKQLAKLKINQAQKEFLNKDDDMTIYNHMVADPYNEPARFYALNHEKGKIMFQISSNSAMGEIAVVELVKK